MDHQDLRTLQILEEIGNDHVPSQRDLAKKLNISLGLVNSFVKRLAQKGYFKIRNVPKNRVKYILTPKGAAEKTRLTYRYIQHSYDFYREARQKLRRLFREFTEQGVRRIVFYGASDIAEIAFVCLQETPIKLAAVVDDFKVDERFLGTVVKDRHALGRISFDKLLVTTVEPGGNILEELQEWGVYRERVGLLKLGPIEDTDLGK